MTNRKLCLISKEVAELLLKQLAHELKNYNLYKSYANYFAVEGIQDLEKYYQKRATEEYHHHEWIFDYLSDADCKFMYPVIEMNSEKFDSYNQPFIQTVDRELLTTEMIYAIYDRAMIEKDYMTISWLQDKLVKEQIEEENVSRMARTIIEETSDIYMRASQILHLLDK